MSDLITMMAASSGAAVQPSGYQISRSLRFNSADSAYLSRTPASAGNRKTWTWSGWVKRSFPDGVTNSTNRTLFSAGDSNPWFQLDFIFFSGGVGNIEVSFTAGTSAGSNSSAIFRDFSAWYHVVLAVDTTQATDSNRIKLYVNGIQQTFSSTNYPSQNFDTQVNNNIAHYIGRANAANYLNGYMAEVHFVDGSALTPSSFGEINETTGVWSPIEYTGSYGTNGFYLDFSDNTSTTTLGYDAAGSNDWTPNNFSVTAGAGNDSLVDTPSQYGDDTGAGGEVRGNYATWNPLWTDSSVTLANGNLQATGASNSNGLATGTIAISSGKWYWESTILGGSSIWAAGIVKTSVATPNYSSLTTDSSYAWNDTGTKYNGQTGSSYGASYTTNDVIGIAVDLDAGTIVFYKNGSSQGTAFTGVSGTFLPMVLCNSGASVATNFGQRPFAYTAPSEFKALVTTNLPEPTVVQGDDYFNTVLYTGAGGTQAITGVGFEPDFVWIKDRSVGNRNCLFDQVRGATAVLFSEQTDAEQTSNAFGTLSSFNSDGFTLTAGSTSSVRTHESPDSYVAWNWNAGGSNATNTDGTITSTVRANTTAGFSIITYTGTGATATVGHGLGVIPAMIITKSRTSGIQEWAVFHQSLSAGYSLFLNTTAAQSNRPQDYTTTLPTSSVYSIGTGNPTNQSSQSFVAYCFAAIPGFSAFGSYTGNGSSDGIFAYLGFRPAWLLLKETGSTSNWILYDNKRDAFNVVDLILNPNIQGTESSYSAIDFVSNGFKFRSSSFNSSGATYIYAAFAENPFKYSLAR